VIWDEPPLQGVRCSNIAFRMERELLLVPRVSGDDTNYAYEVINMSFLRKQESIGIGHGNRAPTCIVFALSLSINSEGRVGEVERNPPIPVSFYCGKGFPALTIPPSPFGKPVLSLSKGSE